MPLQFRKRPTEPPTANVLAYGAPKCGKTTFAASGPGGTLLINADQPNATLYAHGRHRDGSLMEVGVGGLSTLIDVVNAIESGQTVVNTVAIDPIGELHRQLLEEASDRMIRPHLDHYGDTTVHIERFCRKMCELPVNFVIVCHETPVRDETSGVIEKLPYTGTTNPALGQKLMGMVDIVAYLGVTDDGDYMAQLINGRGRRGGDRFDVLGAARKPDLSEWLKVIHQAHSSATGGNTQAVSLPTEEQVDAEEAKIKQEITDYEAQQHELAAEGAAEGAVDANPDDRVSTPRRTTRRRAA